jgi:hypothetical protein
MGVVNTTYTFSGTDTITSSKLNNIIDDTTFTGDAIQGNTLQVVSPGKLAVNAGGITSNEMAANSVVTAAITDSNVTTAKIADSNVTQAKLGANVTTNGPAFSVFLPSNQSITVNTYTVVQLSSEEYDTASCFNTSTYRFTPNVAGYYQINASLQIDGTGTAMGTTFVILRKNGSTEYTLSIRLDTSMVSFLGSGSRLIYMNGSTDYIELIGILTSGGTSPVIWGGVGRTSMSGFLARSA